MYPKAFEDFILNAVTGWYGLQEKEHNMVGKKMREGTYTQRGGRAEVSLSYQYGH